MMLDLWNEFDRQIKHIKNVEPGSPEYDKSLSQIGEIVHIQNKILEREEFVSKMEKLLRNPALVGAVAQLGMTLLVINHERLNVITSRAFGWIRPMK